ncbi:MAG: hypothetical protein JWP25_9021 [Bradyrhizobium sp.]|nr:hypothetical protein [Bradyrhizobium sp.]
MLTQDERTQSAQKCLSANSAADPRVSKMRTALETAKANILDHQGCIMPSHLMDAVVREIDSALRAAPCS